ncbi:MAG: hypothetical protein IPJ34_11940 [Myxococcales bacterium]|nr:hypothetical protein [Myxococcales bacterium]
MRWLLGLLLASAVSCSSKDEPGTPCAVERLAPDGRCLPESCAGDAVRLDGVCRPVGVDTCAAGFDRVEGGCSPRLPTCPAGSYAFPGEACQPLDACGASRFAGSGADALYVDASATGGGDGTEARPFATIVEALTALKATGKKKIYVAKGRYVERMVLDREVELRGVCSGQTEVVAPAGDLADTTIHVASTATITGLTVTGAGHAVGIGTQGSATLAVKGVIVRGHDTGIDVPRIASPKVPTLTLDGLRVEDGRIGVSSYVAVDARRVSIAHVDTGLIVLGGGGVEALVVEDAASEGVLVLSGTTSIARSVVRDVGKRSAVAGYGVVVDKLPTLPAPFVKISDTFVADVTGVGIGAANGAVEVDRCTVRDAGPSDSNLGAGLALYGDGRLSARRTAVLHAPMMGVYATGGELSLEDVLFRDVATGKVAFAGIVARAGSNSGAVALRGVLVDDARLVGLLVAGRTARVAGLRVRHVSAGPEATYGDAVSVGALPDVPALLELSELEVTDTARAGVSVFGGELRLREARICAGFPFEASDDALSLEGGSAKSTATLKDDGGNTCGCGALAACVAARSRLAPLFVPPPGKP